MAALHLVCTATSVSKGRGRGLYSYLGFWERISWVQTVKYSQSIGFNNSVTQKCLVYKKEGWKWLWFHLVLYSIALKTLSPLTFDPSNFSLLLNMTERIHERRDDNTCSTINSSSRSKSRFYIHLCTVPLINLINVSRRHLLKRGIINICEIFVGELNQENCLRFCSLINIFYARTMQNACRISQPQHRYLLNFDGFFYLSFTYKHCLY